MINICFNELNKTLNYLSGFVDTFSLSNLLNRKTCHNNLSGTAIGIMLTNRPNCFQETSTIATGLSDFHKRIISRLKQTFEKIPPNKRLCFFVFCFFL